MFDGKFICTLIAIVVVVMSISKEKEKKIIEPFWGIQRGIRGNPATTLTRSNNLISRPGLQDTSTTLMNPNTSSHSAQLVSTMTNNLSSLNFSGGQEGFMVPPNMQMNLSPRGTAESFNLGSKIKYNTPVNSNSNSQYHDMVQENYNHEVGCASSGSNYASPPNEQIGNNGNYDELLNQLPKSSAATANLLLSNSLPTVPTMTEFGANVENYGNDEEDNVVNYQRMMISLPKSRNQSHDCPIRGPLSISKESGNWFRTHLTADDLGRGAMGVLGGIDAVDPKIIRREAGLGKKYAAGLLMTPEELSSVNAISDLSVDLLPHVMTSN